MTCEERKDLIPLFALGALEPGEEQDLRAHLSAGCPLCEGQLAEANALLSELPFALPPVQPPAELKARLMKRVNADSPAAPIKLPARPASRWIGPAFMGLAAGLIVATGVSLAIFIPQRSRMASMQARLDVVGSDLDDFKKQNADLQKQSRDLQATGLAMQKADREKDLLIDGLRKDVLMVRDMTRLVSKPGIQMVDLKGMTAQPGARARAFVDANGRKMLLCCDNLKPLPDGKEYELWLVSGDRKIPMGTFKPDASGEAMTIPTIPADIGPLAAAAVTDEPAGGMPQPTGAYQLLGAFTN